MSAKSSTPSSPIAARNDRRTLIKGVALVAFFNIFILHHAPPGILDTRLFYSIEEARKFFASLGSDGLEQYRIIAFADLCLIAAYTRLGVGCWKRLPKTPLAKLAFLPGAFDLIETLGVLALIGLFPNSALPIYAAIAVATPLKWLGFLVQISAYTWWWRTSKSCTSQVRA